MAQFCALVKVGTGVTRRRVTGGMKIVKLEDFHADGGWDTYSFLKITTDEGVTGWSEFNESRRRGMTAVMHGLGAALIGRIRAPSRASRRRSTPRPDRPRAGSRRTPSPRS